MCYEKYTDYDTRREHITPSLKLFWHTTSSLYCGDTARLLQVLVQLLAGELLDEADGLGGGGHHLATAVLHELRQEGQALGQQQEVLIAHLYIIKRNTPERIGYQNKNEKKFVIALIYWCQSWR